VIAGVGNLVGDDTKGVTDALEGLFGK